MDWIAKQYGLQLPTEYEKKPSCFQGRGDRMDFNKTVCRTSFGTYCDFTEVEQITGKVFSQCRLYEQEGFAYNVNQCLTNIGGIYYYANCANNCIGVDPNAIIGAGVAAVTASGILATELVVPILGGMGALGVAGALGAGSMMTAQSMCAPPFYCMLPSTVQ